MSFQPKNLWMLSNSGCVPEGEMGYDGCSKVEQKRVHQWFMDADGPELFSNKKQAVEAGSSRSILGGAMDSPLWHNASDFQSVSGHFGHRLFGSEIVHNANMVDRNVASVGGGNILMGRENFGEQYALSASMGLSISHAAQALPGDVSFGGNRKEKINRVNDSGNDNSAFLEQSYNTVNNDTWSPGVSYHKGNCSTISLGPIYAIGDEHTISAVPTFGKEDGNFISTGHKGEGKNFPMGNYTKGDENILTIGLPLDKGETNFTAVAQSYRMGDNSTISVASSYEKEQCSFISMGSTYDKRNGNFISMGPSYVKGDENMISIGSMYDKPDSNVTSIGSIQDNRDPSAFTVGQNARGDDIISFSGFPDAPEVNHSDGVTSGYGAVISNKGLGKTLRVPDQSEQIQSAEPDVNEVQKAYPKTDAAPKNKESKATKKVPTNNFPSNVKSLLSTGMLDGVPVKYVSWSREKNLKGIIKGTGYLCGCDECNFKKTLNAYEFERHANCKTKHPNNHIYFENGKTIYAVVQELKNTPQELLFDSIQNVTGSPIDQKNFGIWKASYQAATRELQRIYGKDEVVIPS